MVALWGHFIEAMPDLDASWRADKIAFERRKVHNVPRPRWMRMMDIAESTTSTAKRTPHILIKALCWPKEVRKHVNSVITGEQIGTCVPSSSDATAQEQEERGLEEEARRLKRERAALAKQSRELLQLPTKKERSQARRLGIRDLGASCISACHMHVIPYAGSWDMSVHL